MVLKDKMNEIYQAIAGLPEENAIFTDPDLKLTWYEMAGGPYGGVYKNMAETLENIFAKIGAQWEDFRFTPSGFHEADGVITVEGNYTGTNRKSGKKVDARVIHLWKLVDGDKIVVEQFTDTALFWKAME